MSGFRAAWREDMPLRFLDMSAHAMLAWALPGPWWLQFLPDVVLPALWTCGMLTDQFDDGSGWLLRAHRLLHLRLRPVAFVCMLFLVATAIAYPPLAGAWLAHVAVDRITHDERWQ